MLYKIVKTNREALCLLLITVLRMNILITGASRGIGYHLVKQFAATKENNIIAISRDIVKLQQLQQECKAEFDNQIQICGQNLEDARFLDLHKSIENLTKIDIVICNAGLLINKPFHEMDPDDWKRLFDQQYGRIARK
jgi:short-subunit dehydrogenase